jgi:hypothetical protein
MFSPVKAITAGALVFAIGGVMLIAQPFEQQPGSVPGAETEAIAPTWVTGNIQHVDGSCSQIDIKPVGDASRSRYECTATWTSSDPRLTGDASRLWNTETYRTDEGAVEVTTEVHYPRNGDGGWACSNRYLGKDSIPATDVLTDYTLTCIGNGGYEGLSAVLQSKSGEDFSEEFVGLIFSGDGPPLPEAPAAE